MIGVPDTLLISAALLVFLTLLTIRGVAAARAASLESGSLLPCDTTEIPACPRDFAARVFSAEDSQFVRATNSPQLAKLFQLERKQVALIWIQQTSAAIQRVMNEHKQIARLSHDIDFETEVKLLYLYSELMLLCGVLFVAVRYIGPVGVRRLAVYADAHSQRLAQVQQSFKAATRPPELPRVGAA
jgi:hypothetical protein